MYVFELPFLKQKALADTLDADNAWEDLAGLMNLTAHEVMACRQAPSRGGQSPSSELLRILGSLGYPVDHLFKLLFKMRHYRAMKVLSDIVDKKYLKLLEKLKPGTDDVDVSTTGIGKLSLTESGACNPLAISSVPSNRESLVAAAAAAAQPNRSAKRAATHNKTTASSVSAEPVLDSVRSMVSVLDNTLSLKFEELREASNDFSPQNILGRGGYGVVYRAHLKHSVVAVKRVSCSSKTVQNPGSNQVSEEEKGRWRQSLMELRISALYRHDNILPLYGHSFDGPEPCLVYQYMPMGSLEDRLLCRKMCGEEKKSLPLSWNARMKIMKGAARGLNFLHTVSKEPLIHGDVKSANILLDAYMEPKLGDFGLSRRGQVEIPNGAPPLIASHIKGTLAYLPPEFIRSKHLSSKLDVFSFGVVLFEVATGFRAYSDRRSPENLVDYVFSLCDETSNFPHIQDSKAGNTNRHLADVFISLGMQCCRKEPEKRISSQEVLSTLESV